MSAVSCASPLRFEELVDYWAKTLDSAREERLEEHAFECDACASRLEVVAALANGLSQLPLRRGGVLMILTPSLLNQLEGASLLLRQYSAMPDQRVPCTVGRDDDLVVTRLQLGANAPLRVDLVLEKDGVFFHRYDDVPVDITKGEVLYSFAGDVVRKLPRSVFRARLLDEHARPLAEYFFEHTPSL